MNRRMLLMATALLLGVEAHRALLQAGVWASRELSPFHRWLAELDRTLPGDARILLLAPASAGSHMYCHELSTRLYPRIVYLLPPGARSPEDAREWIRIHRLSWVISLGDPDAFNPHVAYARRIDDGR